MAQEKRDDLWVVDLLDVRPTDRVLDVGCGPGVAIELIAERASDGRVVGVDPSTVMLREAARRNRPAVRTGRVELRLGTAERVPYPDAHFTKACAIHSLYFWPSVEAGLHEFRRVLAPKGLLVLAVRTRHPEAGRFDPSRYGLTPEQIAEVTSTLESAGFRDVSTRQQQIGRQTILAILARR